ncbi:uncharacterized protein LAESUDRAFT_727442 [Laetiporus sulphureus 93-53]|uniref:BHLH domain-containing protein n=1 Tax=Laetiporus sulphureus 93-53 TaxID=1314785 RepID=A0A165DH59_9APHY|nr:uncharacterized protein LAESUDRAFT_727442 [Laetiporus sulphureus 93-53]KZT04869.1 hypothetical protein LAESUDRAFT_727442 [Laetiporus sulphureus 93-53]
MTNSKSNTPSYAGSCNPPRRAKRQRANAMGVADVTASDKQSTSSRRSRPPILPKAHAEEISSPQAEMSGSDAEEEDDYEPDVRPSGPRRRGRKPGVLSRSVRESLRKLNHSRIEKARRTKINDALSTLSMLVNEAERQEGKENQVEGVEEKEGGKEDGKRPRKARPEEKEFKLDVLVKTVTYMQELIERVKVLESGCYPKCSNEAPPSSSSAGMKRKRPAEDEEEGADTGDHNDDKFTDDEDTYAGDDEKGDGEDVELTMTSPMLPAASSASSPPPRLPSIASWLPYPYVDPSCIAILSKPPASATTSPNIQLPSPPPSDNLRPSTITPVANVPPLVLPEPAHPIFPSAPSRIAIPISSITSPLEDASDARERRASVSSSRSSGWTPEDESAASLLLQMSTSPTGLVPTSSVSKGAELSARSSTSPSWATTRPILPVPLLAETPSSLLGLRRR